MFGRRRKPPPSAGLHQCPVCRGDTVVPVESEQLDLCRRAMRLRCGECETYRDVVISEDVAKRYDLDLDRGMAEIAAALRREDRDRMTAEARAFIAALEHDLIDAADFAD